jgi:mRNA-degrading endonuclease YafQ of YafQ-DinJ toxin-antitoxin module
MPIKLSERFASKYEDLPLNLRLKVDKAISLLNENFRHPGLRSHRIKGYEDIYEAHVDQKYRMTYERRSDVLIMRNVDNHDECLKNP